MNTDYNEEDGGTVAEAKALADIEARELSNDDIDKAVAEAVVATPRGLSKLTEHALIVLGVFVSHRNRALAVQEVETILSTSPNVPELDVEDCYVELETANLIYACPTEVHAIGDTNVYGETFNQVAEQTRYRLS